MSVQRRVNFLSEQRVDIPDLRSIESAVSADFDALAQSFFTGPSQGYILRGFEIVMASAIGGAASSLQVKVDPGAIFHVTSELSGTFYLVPTGTAVQTLNSATNTIVNGAFTPNAINYVSLEYQRLADSTTEAQTYFWDPVQDTETTKLTPRAQVLSYTLNITTTVPDSTFLPIAVVSTDSSNNVTEVTDARWLMFRLGAGGYSPNPFYQFPWSQGRSESVASSTSNSVDPFSGGDKAIGTLKDWMNAVMTSFQEIKGTTYWYSVSSSGSTQSLREDLGNTVITGKGSIAHGVLPSDGTTVTAPGQVNWDQPINIRVIGSELTYTLAANATSQNITLTDNQVAYINLVRNIAITPNLIFTNASPTVSSVGGVSWTTPLQPGDWVKLASDTSAGYFQIASVDSLTQVTLTSSFTEASTGVAGLQAEYSFGTYQAVASPTSNRDIQIADRGSVPQGQDVFWFLLRSDNAGAARVYVRFLSSELTQGESEDISGQTPEELLKYVGSPSLGSYAPQYAAALSAGAIPQIETFTYGTAAQIPQSSYYYMYSANNARQYYIWFNKDSGGTDPAVTGKNASIKVAITTGMTAAQVALAVQNALNASPSQDFTAVQSTVNTAQVKVTNNSAGSCYASTDQNVGSPFAIVLTQQGTGTGNNFINDGDSLTLAIKKLDSTIAAIIANTNNPSYDEPMAIIAGTPANTNQLQGPIDAGTTITLPENSRESEIQQVYTVGRGNLILALNGQVLNINEGSVTSAAIVSYGFTGNYGADATLTTGGTKYAIAYTPSANVNATSVKFMLAASGTCVGSLTANIYSNSGSQPGSVLGTSGAQAASVVGTTDAAVTFYFGTPVSLTSGTTYWFEIEGDATYLAGSNRVNLAYPTTGATPYPWSFYNGTAWASLATPTPTFEIDGTQATGSYDWTEVGTAGVNSSSIQINRPLVIGDILTFRIITGAVAPAGGSGGGSGGGGTGPQGPAGPAGPAGTNALYAMTISTKSSNYGVVSGDNVLLANCASQNITFTLPTASTITGRVYVFKKIDNSTNIVTITTAGGQLIDGMTTQTVTLQFESLTVVTDGSAFYLI